MSGTAGALWFLGLLVVVGGCVGLFRLARRPGEPASLWVPVALALCGAGGFGLWLAIVFGSVRAGWGH